MREGEANEEHEGPPVRESGPDIHVVIATKDRPDLLRRTLGSLARCDRPPHFSSVVVVENGGGSGARDVCRDAPASLNVRYEPFARANKCAALNHVLEQLSDGLLLFLDDDVRATDGLLSAYARAAEGVSGGVFYGGPVAPDYEVPPPEWLVAFLPPSTKGWSREHDGEGFVDEPVFLGANWAAFAGDLRRVGGFDASMGPGSVSGSLGDETDMQARLLAVGVQGRYVPEALVYHWVPRERSTPSWALERIYRHGIWCGLRGRPDVPRLFGRPRWAVRRSVQSWLAAQVWRLHPDPGRRFAARASHAWVRGVLRGARQAADRV
ncbi:MAG: glycosyltransferase [Armatimonadota bacterium]|nr:glycosyltransferase [Armatimonadota bacterium]